MKKKIHMTPVTLISPVTGDRECPVCEAAQDERVGLLCDLHMDTVNRYWEHPVRTMKGYCPPFTFDQLFIGLDAI